jgi:hypothetical protein
MEREVVYTTSPALRAFVTLILAIAGGKAQQASQGRDRPTTADISDEARAMDCRWALGILIGPVGRPEHTRSRLLTLGPFVTLILTIRCQQVESDDVCWPGYSLSCREVKSATALRGRAV